MIESPVRGAALDHVAVAVRDPAPAARLFRDVLGASFLMGADSPDQAFRFVQYRFPGGGKVELLEPLGEGFLLSFLDKRGEGLHHVTFKTDDIRAAIDHLRTQGYELVDVNIENPHWKEAFLRPSKSHGTLIQIAQSSAPDDVVRDRPRPSNLDELLGT